MSEAASIPRRALPPGATAVATSLYRHRLLTTSQLYALHDPDVTIRTLRRRLAKLETRGYAARVYGPPPGGQESRWFLTDLGADLAEEFCQVRRRPYRMDAERAAWARHLLAVNDVGVALTEAARRHGDVFDHRSWSHEVPHPYGPSDREVIISDAVVRYEVWGEDNIDAQLRFLELDRGGESVHELVEKLRGYAALHDYRPRRRKEAKHLAKTWWRRRYSVFPGVLFVLADLTGSQVTHRLEALAGFADSDPQVDRARHLTVTATTLGELQNQGPFEPVGWRIPTLERTPLYRRARS